MRENNIIITIDYETWQPVPEGESINWEEDLLSNTNCLMETCERVGAKLTLMVEACEYFWLLEKDKDTANKIEEQIKAAVARGHDVQLHMHPNWLPQLGAEYSEGIWHWDWQYGSCNDYPYDLTELIRRCKERLELVIREVKENYTVTAFRAGAYRVQPFERISEALLKNEIFIDCSVYKGGRSMDRGYDFSQCKSYSQPYRADMTDPQKVSETNSMIIELPITTWKRGERWFLDNNEAEIFGKRFLNLDKKYFGKQKNFFVMIGHSKGKHDYISIEEQLKILSSYPNTKFTTISECAKSIENTVLHEGENMCRSIQEVQQIMQYLYDIIEPGNSEDCDRADMVLKKRKALCCGYAVTLYKILRQYGYKVKCLTIYAENMPRGRGEKKIDTHEIVELRLNNQYYLLDCTTNTVIPYRIEKVLKNPQLAIPKIQPDNRYLKRDYFNYDTHYFYERVIYFVRKRGCEYHIQGESFIQFVKRQVYVYLYHIIPNHIRLYNIYRGGQRIGLSKRRKE